VNQRRFARERSFDRRPEEVGLQLDRREAGCALRQRRDTAVAARRVRESDNGAGVEIAVRREQLVAQAEPHANATRLDLFDLDPDQSGKAVLPDLAERVEISQRQQARWAGWARHG